MTRPGLTALKPWPPNACLWHNRSVCSTRSASTSMTSSNTIARLLTTRRPTSQPNVTAAATIATGLRAGSIKSSEDSIPKAYVTPIDRPSGGELPIFVVGMPRSGTSLAEQILASHPSVFGAGELVYWNNAYDTLNESGSSPEHDRGGPVEIGDRLPPAPQEPGRRCHPGRR